MTPVVTSVMTPVVTPMMTPVMTPRPAGFSILGGGGRLLCSSGSGFVETWSRRRGQRDMAIVAGEEVVLVLSWESLQTSIHCIASHIRLSLGILKFQQVTFRYAVFAPCHQRFKQVLSFTKKRVPSGVCSLFLLQAKKFLNTTFSYLDFGRRPETSA